MIAQTDSLQSLLAERWVNLGYVSTVTEACQLIDSIEHRNTPTIIGSDVICPAGMGYYDLSFYPWGGSFRRFTQATVCTLDRVVTYYRDNTTPRRIMAKMGNTPVGIEL